MSGTRYTGRTAWLGAIPRQHSTAEAEAFLADFPEGSAVRVHHDPADPARSAVFIKADPALGTEFMIPGVVLLLGGLALFRVLRTAPDRK